MQDPSPTTVVVEVDVEDVDVEDVEVVDVTVVVADVVGMTVVDVDTVVNTGADGMKDIRTFALTPANVAVTSTFPVAVAEIALLACPLLSVVSEVGLILSYGVLEVKVIVAPAIGALPG